MACGTALGRSCPACGEDLPPEARFCMACGAEVATAPAAAAEPPPEERRQVTVLFADLSGFTAIAERLDPEQVKSLVDRCLARLGQEVVGHGGTVDKYIGDNVMAIFGAPVAHEDDAERAVRAGLAMQHAMEELNADVAERLGVKLALRVGINTGEVLAGAVGSGYTVIGDTVNVAARLQSAANAGSVTVGGRTYAATAATISYRQLAPLTVRNRAEPVEAWEALEPIAAAPAPTSSTPLVGRSDELELLLMAQEHTREEGVAHLLTVLGEAGVGKSRLIAEARTRLLAAENTPTWRQGRCLPYGSGIVYWALGEILRDECGIVESDDADLAWHKLSHRLADLFPDDAEAAERRAAVIGRLLGIEGPTAVDAGADPQRLRDEFFSAVRATVEALARANPIVLVFEDIHWADEGMLDLIEHLAHFVRAPLLVVCLARAELLDRRPGWGEASSGETTVELAPLSAREASTLISALLPAGDPATISLIAERAGGNPFFVEELARRVASEGGTDAMPDTIQGLLAARLDALDPFERRLVQHAAVVGRTFWGESLQPIAAEFNRDLESALAGLEAKDILVLDEGGSRSDEPELAFRHVLIRDVAYAMLPKAVRAQKHYEVGEFIERRAGDRTDEVVALLAEHYGRAARLAGEASLETARLSAIRAKAVPFLEAAGDAAAALFSNPEAVGHYRMVRELTTGVDQAAHARVSEKLGDVDLRLGRVEAAVQVWEDARAFHEQGSDVECVARLHRKIGAALAHQGERKRAVEHHQKGINLLKDGEPSLELVHLYEEAAWLYTNTGDNMLAVYAAEKALRLAEQLGETRAVSRAHGTFGRVFGRAGDVSKAREHLERAVELAEASDQQETIVALLALGNHLEATEADYASAQKAYASGLELAERIGEVPAQIELHAALARLAANRADWDDVAASSDASASLCEREGLVGKLCLPLVLRALLCWREADWEEAEALYARAHDLAEQVGWSEVVYWALFGSALVRRDRGDLEGAIEALDGALQVCDRAGLVGLSIQALAARAQVLAALARGSEARTTAEWSLRLANSLRDPIGYAAAAQADGATQDAPGALGPLREARERWLALGRPLDAAQCDLLLARKLADEDPEGARVALAAAAESFEALGVDHLARQAKAAA